MELYLTQEEFNNLNIHIVKESINKEKDNIRRNEVKLDNWFLITCEPCYIDQYDKPWTCINNASKWDREDFFMD